MTDPNFNPNAYPQPTTKRRVDLDGPDFYPTPAWATRALLDNEKFEGTIWEPACGNGAMSNVLIQAGYRVDSSDMYDRGFGSIHDFTKTDLHNSVENIITNPPYNSAEEFVHIGSIIVKNKLALLLRLAFLESASRYRTIYSHNPPSRVWIFSERITFYPANAEIKGSGTTAYAWFVWDKQATGCELKWLPPIYSNAKIESVPSLDDLGL